MPERDGAAKLFSNGQAFFEDLLCARKFSMIVEQHTQMVEETRLVIAIPEIAAGMHATQQEVFSFFIGIQAANDRGEAGYKAYHLPIMLLLPCLLHGGEEETALALQARHIRLIAFNVSECILLDTALDSTNYFRVKVFQALFCIGLEQRVQLIAGEGGV